MAEAPVTSKLNRSANPMNPVAAVREKTVGMQTRLDNRFGGFSGLGEARLSRGCGDWSTSATTVSVRPTMYESQLSATP